MLHCFRNGDVNRQVLKDKTCNYVFFLKTTLFKLVRSPTREVYKLYLSSLRFLFKKVLILTKVTDTGTETKNPIINSKK